MAIVQDARDPSIAAAEAGARKYGTPLGAMRRYELQVVAAHFGLNFPTGSTKNDLLQILMGNGITIDRLMRTETDPATGLVRQVSILPELMHNHITRFDRLREQAIEELESLPAPIFQEPEAEPDKKPFTDYASLSWNDLRTLAQERGLKVYGKKRDVLVEELEALDG